MNICYSTILLLVILTLSSCSDWLNLEPENDLIRNEFWKTKEDVMSVLAATYDSFREGGQESLIWGELRADMALISGTGYGEYQNIAESDISVSNSKISWSEYYQTINLANTILQFVDDVQKIDKSFTLEERDGIKAEALFIRSLCYFYLVRLWKDVPIVLQSSSSDTVDFFQPKSPEHLVIKQITSDLLRAESIAFTNQFENEPSKFKGRANIYSIQALLADVYLWCEQYLKCIEYCDKIIQSGKFVLLPEQSWFNMYYPGNSMEGIFEIQYNDKYANENNPIYNNDGLLPIIGVRKIKLSANASELFAPADIRTIDRKYAYWKYLGASYDGTPRNNNERDAHFIHYRYADILLMKAEALAELQKFTEANYFINEVVQRAGLPPVIFDERIADIRSYILDERGREFMLEGKRWFDVLRFAKKNKFENKQLIIDMILAGASAKIRPIIRSRVLDTMSYYLPIPEKDLLYNPNLIQNPYYER